MGNMNSQQVLQLCNDVFQESVTNVLNNNQSTVQSVTKITQDIVIDTCPPGYTSKSQCGNIDCENLNITQKINANSKMITEITDSMTSELQTQMDNALDNNIQQAIKQAMGFLAPGSEDSDITTQITNRVKQIIKNYISTNNLNGIIHETVAYQGINLTVGDISGKACNIDQDVFIEMVTSSIIKNIANAIVNDTLLNKIVNTVKQKSDSSMRGLDDALKAGAMLALALAFMYIAMNSAGKGAMGSIIKIVILLIVIAVIYLVIAWFFRFTPFQIKDRWGCELKDGLPTGECIKIDNGPYKFQQDCENDVKNGISCLQGWNYKDDGSLECVQQPGVSLFTSKEDCENSFLWSCSVDANNYTDGKNTIQKYTKDTIPIAYNAPGYFAKTQAEMQQLAPRACQQYWYYGNKDKTCYQTSKDGIMAPVSFPTEQQCKDAHK